MLRSPLGVPLPAFRSPGRGADECDAGWRAPAATRHRLFPRLPVDPLARPGKKLRPDFSFIEDAGDVVVWEHLGMLARPDYREGWDWKRAWYARNGYDLGRNLFTTEEIGGLDMRAVEATATAVRAALA